MKIPSKNIIFRSLRSTQSNIQRYTFTSAQFQFSNTIAVCVPFLHFQSLSEIDSKKNPIRSLKRNAKYRPKRLFSLNTYQRAFSDH